MFSRAAIVIVSLLALLGEVSAIPNAIDYQGFLTNNDGSPLDTVVIFLSTPSD